MLTAARERWPDVSLSPQRFAAYLAERAQEAPLDGPGLYLACACLEGDRAAQSVLQRLVSTALSHLPPSARVARAREDLLQNVMSQLLVAKNRAPKIASYSGRGPLEAWLRAVAMRAALTEARRRGDTPGENVPESALTDWNVELHFIKAHYRPAFRAAFSKALESLTAEQRTLLRMCVVDGLSHQQIAQLRGVHQTTATRWLAAIRAELFDKTRAQLTEVLGVRKKELESLLEDVQSSLEISLEALR